MERDPNFEAVWNFIVGDATPKRRGRSRPRREPLKGTAALFAEHFRVYGGGYGMYDRNNTDDDARDLAMKWAQSSKTEQDARQFLRLGGRPTELWMLEQWDALGQPRSLLAHTITHRVSGEEISVIELIRSGRFTVAQVARSIAGWQKHRDIS